MGRLVWFGLFALNPAAAVAVVAAGTVAVAAAGYVAGSRRKKK